MKRQRGRRGKDKGRGGGERACFLRKCLDGDHKTVWELQTSSTTCCFGHIFICIAHPVPSTQVFSYEPLPLITSTQGSSQAWH